MVIQSLGFHALKSLENERATRAWKKKETKTDFGSEFIDAP